MAGTTCPTQRGNQMPNSTNRLRNARIVSYRDQGYTFDHIANLLGMPSAQAVRSAWLVGMRNAGRTVPTTSVRVHSGRTTRTITTETLAGFNTLSTMTFGIEIECIGLDCARAFRALRNAGVSVVNAGYTHTIMSEWKVVPDGSLNSRNGSCEVVSPILRGKQGIDEIRTVMSILRTAGASVDTSCGMHIHIGVKHFNNIQLANIVRDHQMWNGAFDALVHIRRTVANGSYLGKRNNRQARELADNIRDASGAVELRDITASTRRYTNLNVASFAKYGTYENRQHQGSLNGMNAGAWIVLTQAFYELSAEGGLPNADSVLDYDELNIVRDGLTLPRNAQKVMAHALINTLHNAGKIETAVANYLHSRADNPSFVMA